MRIPQVYLKDHMIQDPGVCSFLIHRYIGVLSMQLNVRKWAFIFQEKIEFALAWQHFSQKMTLLKRARGINRSGCPRA